MRKKYNAFTLIEMLIGLSIFSIIALSIYGTFSSGVQLNRRSEDLNKIYREIRWSLNTIAKDLENMVDYNFSSSYPESLSFTGKSERISFFMPTDEGLKTVSYYLEPLEYGSVYKTVIGRHTKKNVDIVMINEEASSISTLVREEKMFAGNLESSVDQELIEKDVLSPSIIEGGLKFSYAYLEGEGEVASITWKDTWVQPYLPSGVRITITFLKPGKKKDLITVERDVYIPIGYLGRENL